MPTVDQIADLLNSTRPREGRNRFQQIAQTLQRYEVMSKIMKQDRVIFDSGQSIKRSIMRSFGNTARMVGLAEADTVSIPTVLSNIETPWRHTTWNFAIERRELLMNRAPEKVVELGDTRRAAAFIDGAELMETQGWEKPADSTVDDHVFGIAYWVVFNASADGFVGSNPSGFTAGAGGLDSDTFTTWRNYSHRYTSFSKADALREMKTGKRLTDFQSPIGISDFRKGRGSRMRIYTNNAVMEDADIVAENQNENLGKDLASMDGVMTVHGNPFIYVPKLDTSDRVGPIYYLNWDYFYPYCLKGDVMVETGFKPSPLQHNLMVNHVDLTWNILCVDRRRQMVFAVS